MPLVRTTLKRQFGINREELWKEYEQKGTVGGLKPANTTAARHCTLIIARRRTIEKEKENESIKKGFKQEGNK